MHDEVAFDHLQEKGSSARDDGNESRDAKGVGTNLDGLNRQSSSCALGPGRTRSLGTRATSGCSASSSGGRSGDDPSSLRSCLGHEGRASSGRLGARFEGSGSTEGTSAGTLSGRLSRVVLVKDEAKLLSRVAHAVSTVVAEGGVVCNTSAGTGQEAMVLVGV